MEKQSSLKRQRSSQLFRIQKCKKLPEDFFKPLSSRPLPICKSMDLETAYVTPHFTERESHRIQQNTENGLTERQVPA